MLLNDLYTIERWSSADPTTGELRALLVLNAAHPIFAGHFPGQPMVPGACQLQMAEELLSHVLEREYRLTRAGQIKFLTPIDPRRNLRIEAVLRLVAKGAAQAEWEVSTIFSAGDAPAPATTPKPAPAVFLKFTGIFRAA